MLAALQRLKHTSATFALLRASRGHDATRQALGCAATGTGAIMWQAT